jgi:hypothetical protein
MISLQLVQTTPANNPDTNITKATVSGQYTQGVGDPLPNLGALADPTGRGQVPLPAAAYNPPPVTPYALNTNIGGYYLQIARVVANGQTTFYAKFLAPGGAELATGVYPAAISGGEIFIAIPVDIETQS